VTSVAALVNPGLDSSPIGDHTESREICRIDVSVQRCSFGTYVCRGVRFLSPGLLQLSVLRHLGRTDESVAVGSELRNPSDYWYSTFRPHNACAPSATLAAGTPERRLQGCDARSPITVWYFTVLPSRRLPSCRRGVCKYPYYIGPITATCLCRLPQPPARNRLSNVLILCTEMIWPIVILCPVVTAR